MKNLFFCEVFKKNMGNSLNSSQPSETIPTPELPTPETPEIPESDNTPEIYELMDSSTLSQVCLYLVNAYSTNDMMTKKYATALATLLQIENFPAFVFYFNRSVYQKVVDESVYPIDTWYKLNYNYKLVAISNKKLNEDGAMALYKNITIEQSSNTIVNKITLNVQSHDMESKDYYGYGNEEFFSNLQVKVVCLPTTVTLKTIDNYNPFVLIIDWSLLLSSSWSLVYDPILALNRLKMLIVIPKYGILPAQLKSDILLLANNKYHISDNTIFIWSSDFIPSDNAVSLVPKNILFGDNKMTFTYDDNVNGNESMVDGLIRTPIEIFADDKLHNTTRAYQIPVNSEYRGEVSRYWAANLKFDNDHLIVINAYRFEQETQQYFQLYEYLNSKEVNKNVVMIFHKEMYKRYVGTDDKGKGIPFNNDSKLLAFISNKAADNNVSLDDSTDELIVNTKRYTIQRAINNDNSTNNNKLLTINTITGSVNSLENNFEGVFTDTIIAHLIVARIPLNE